MLKKSLFVVAAILLTASMALAGGQNRCKPQMPDVVGGIECFGVASNLGQVASGNYAQGLSTSGMLVGGHQAQAGPVMVSGDKSVIWCVTGQQAGQNSSAAQGGGVDVTGMAGGVVLNGDTQVVGESLGVSAGTTQSLATTGGKCWSPSVASQTLAGSVVVVANDLAISPGAISATSTAVGVSTHGAQFSAGGGMLSQGASTDVTVTNVAGSMD